MVYGGSERAYGVVLTICTLMKVGIKLASHGAQDNSSDLMSAPALEERGLSSLTKGFGRLAAGKKGQTNAS